MNALSPAPRLPPIDRSLTIAGKRFELSVTELASRSWHWILAAPGELVLSGEAPSEMRALAIARRAGRALARLIAA